jgi:hypothetical protein
LASLLLKKYGMSKKGVKMAMSLQDSAASFVETLEKVTITQADVAKLQKEDAAKRKSKKKKKSAKSPARKRDRD